MASLNVTLEDGQTTVKAIGNVEMGWQKGAFRGRGSIPYVNDTILTVHLDIFPPNKLAPFVTEFPIKTELQEHRDGSLCYRLRLPNIEVLANLVENGTILARGKPGIFWQPTQPISTYLTKLWLRLTVFIQPRYQSKSKVSWEYDVLPFLPGGQFESKRSRH